MLTFLNGRGKENIILFIHGFRGGKETWKSEVDSPLFIPYLMEEAKIKENYDFAIFDYFTKVTDVFEKVGVIKKLFNPSAKVEKNLSIDDLSDLLLTEVEVTLEDYKRIVLVGHSMGGLVSKDCILKTLKKKSRIHLYISIAVPHNGAKLADLAKLIFNSPQIEALRPLEEYNTEINKQWIANADQLPSTIYHQGKLDRLVARTSSIGYDAREDVAVVYSNHDHNSIVRPHSPYDVVVNSTRKALLALIDAPLLANTKPNLPTTKTKEMEPSVMIASIVGYLTKKVKDDKSVTGFLSDFTAATVAWLRPLFLTDEEEPKPKEFMQDLINDPVDEKGHNRRGVLNVMEKALDKDQTGMALGFIKEMYEVINAKKEDGEDVGSGGISIINSTGVTAIDRTTNSTITVTNTTNANPPKKKPETPEEETGNTDN